MSKRNFVPVQPETAKEAKPFPGSTTRQTLALEQTETKLLNDKTPSTSFSMKAFTNKTQKRRKLVSLSSGADSLNLPNSIRNTLENVLTEAEIEEQTNFLRQKLMLMEEIERNQELLWIRQQRISHLEETLKMMHIRKRFIPEEEWLPRKMVLVGEINQHKELFAVQMRRCQSLEHSLAFVNRKVFDMREKEELMRQIKVVQGNGTQETMGEAQSNKTALGAEQIQLSGLHEMEHEMELATRREEVKKSALSQDMSRYRLPVDQSLTEQAAFNQTQEEEELRLIRQNIDNLIHQQGLPETHLHKDSQSAIPGVSPQLSSTHDHSQPLSLSSKHVNGGKASDAISQNLGKLSQIENALFAAGFEGQETQNASLPPLTMNVMENPRGTVTKAKCTRNDVGLPTALGKTVEASKLKMTDPEKTVLEETESDDGSIVI